MSFDEALSLAETILDIYCQKAAQYIPAREMWDKLPVMGKFKVSESTDFIVGWQEFAAEDGLLGLISPNLRGGWQVLSYDTDSFILPTAENSTFRHPNGFIIVFSTREEAIEYAERI